MIKFEIIFYHAHGQYYNRFHVLARDEDKAREAFALKYPINWIEEVYEWSEPTFRTKNEIEDEIQNKEKRCLTDCK